MYLTHVYTISRMDLTVAGYCCVDKHNQLTNQNLERNFNYEQMFNIFNN